jgi:hypothetical protein
LVLGSWEPFSWGWPQTAILSLPSSYHYRHESPRPSLKFLRFKFKMYV